MDITKVNGKHVLILDDKDMNDLVYCLDCGALNSSTLVTAQLSVKDNYRELQRRVKALGRIINDYYERL
jgi:hypothetical protein